MNSRDKKKQAVPKCIPPERFFPKIEAEWYRRRLLRMVALFAPVFLVLLIQLFNLQILKGEHYREISENNCLRKQRVHPLRGHISDRNGHLLVDNRPAFNLYVVPSDIAAVQETAVKLAAHIERPPEEIITLISRNRGPYGYRPVLLKADIGRDLMGQILARRYEMPGVIIQASPRRNYIYDHFAPHLLGYIGEINARELVSPQYSHKRSGDMVGRLGVERTFESYLSGYPGTRLVQVNATGQVMAVFGEEPALSGDNVRLTLDFHLQRIAQALLEGESGAIVAIDPSNGDILAMVSSPAFDQRLFADGISRAQWQDLLENPERPLHNRAVQAAYPPASAYKIITAMAALEERVVSEHSTEFCTGQYRLGDRVFRCWKRHGHGHQNIIDAMSESCDVYFYEAGRQLGVDRIAQYATASGLGVRTGIPLDNEASGLVPTAMWKQGRFGIPWFGGETLPVAIGQGYNLTTPLQMGMLTAAVANGGTLFRPQMLKKIQSADGTIVKQSEPEPVASLPVSEKNLEIIKKGLYNVVNHPRGTAYHFARSTKVEIAGKTGTAQVVSRLTEEIEELTSGELTEEEMRRFKTHAWFVGYAPANDPKIAVSVLVEHGGGGGSIAGPIAKELIVSYIDIMENRIIQE